MSIFLFMCATHFYYKFGVIFRVFLFFF